jgi:hypothetical protein
MTLEITPQLRRPLLLGLAAELHTFLTIAEDAGDHPLAERARSVLATVYEGLAYPSEGALKAALKGYESVADRAAN